MLVCGLALSRLGAGIVDARIAAVICAAALPSLIPAKAGIQDHVSVLHDRPGSPPSRGRAAEGAAHRLRYLSARVPT